MEPASTGCRGMGVCPTKRHILTQKRLTLDKQDTGREKSVPTEQPRAAHELSAVTETLLGSPPPPPQPLARTPHAPSAPQRCLLSPASSLERRPSPSNTTPEPCSSRRDPPGRLPGETPGDVCWSLCCSAPWGERVSGEMTKSTNQTELYRGWKQS